MHANPISASGKGRPALGIVDSLASWQRSICEQPAESVEEDRGLILDGTIAADIGTGKVGLVHLDDGLLLLHMRGRFHEDLNYRIAGEGWTRLHFRKSARSSMDFEGIGVSEYEGPLCQILHQPRDVRDEEWIEGGVDLEWITMFIQPELLVERYRLDTVTLQDPVRRLANGADDFLLRNWSLSPEMIQAMSQVLLNHFTGDIRRLHLDAKATELICMMSQVMAERSATGLPVKLSSADVERLHAARAILTRNFAAPPSVDTLARQVGLNRNKLCYGFRHLFERSVADFSAECRLQSAWEMLRDSELPIGLIAEKVGYRQAAAFSTAFRQRFGMTPRQARKGAPAR